MGNFKQMGRLTRDFEIRQVGKFYVCKSDLVYNRLYKNKDGVYPSDFIRIELWTSSEAYIDKIKTQYTKGKRVFVSGNLEMDKYQVKDGSTRTMHKIKCDNYGGCILIDYDNTKQNSSYNKKDGINNAEFTPENEFNPYGDFEPVGGEEDIPF